MSPVRLEVESIKTPLFHPGDDLEEFLYQSLGKDGLIDGDVLAITSKIVSLAENQVVPKSEIAKGDLVRREADEFLGQVGYGVSLTIKHGLFIPSSGIDESNAEGEFFILFPKAPFASAKRIWAALRRRYGIKNLGIILTDSHTQPLRRGVTGIALSHWGIRGTRKLVGEKDLFGRQFTMTYVNVVDALATSAVFVMGEGTEPRPLARLRSAEVEFCDETDPSEIRIPPGEDLYSPIYRVLLRQSE